MPRISPAHEQAQQKRICKGAAQVFAENGYRQTTIDQICLALNLSKGAIYTYFNSKADLYIAVLRSIYDQRLETLSSAFQPDDSIPVKFEKILDRLASLMSRDDSVYKRLSLEGFLECDHLPGLQAIKSDSYRRSYELIHGLLQEGQKTGEINPALNISSTTTILMAVSDGLMLHSLVDGRGIDPERVRSLLQETFSPILGYPSEK